MLTVIKPMEAGAETTEQTPASGCPPALRIVGRMAAVLFALVFVATVIEVSRRWPASLSASATESSPAPAVEKSTSSSSESPLGPAVEDVAYPSPVAIGDNLSVTAKLTYRGSGEPVKVLPIAILLDKEGHQHDEGDWHTITLFTDAPPIEVEMDLSTTGLYPGKFYIAVVLLDQATGKKVGKGAYHRKVQLTAPNQ